MTTPIPHGGDFLGALPRMTAHVRPARNEHEAQTAPMDTVFGITSGKRLLEAWEMRKSYCEPLGYPVKP